MSWETATSLVINKVIKKYRTPRGIFVPLCLCGEHSVLIHHKDTKAQRHKDFTLTI